MTGALQIGATVNDGESCALNQLAEWASSPVCVAVGAAHPQGQATHFLDREPSYQGGAWAKVWDFQGLGFGCQPGRG